MPGQKYEAIYNDLKEKIEEGIYAPQSILPSENNHAQAGAKGVLRPFEARVIKA